MARSDTEQEILKEHTVLPDGVVDPTQQPGKRLFLHKKSKSPADTSEARPWGPIAAVIYGSLIFFASQLVAALAIAAGLYGAGWNSARIDDWMTQATFGQFIFILIAELLVIWGVVRFVRRRRVALIEIGITKFRLKYVWKALLGLGAYFGLFIVTAVLFSQLAPSVDFDQKQEIGFDSVTTTSDLILTGISLIVLPPLAEEVLFRGFLYKGLRNKFSFPVAAVATSLLFALGHLQFGSGAPLLWVAGLDTFVLSVVLCYLREKTGSLWSGIMIHAAKNAVAFSVLFLFK